MESANLELVRSIYAAWAGGDFSSTAWADPEIEYATADGPAPGHWLGLAGMASGFRDWLSMWESWRAVAEDFLELDGERVLVPFHLSGRGKTSGLDLDQLQTKGATLFHIRHGKVTRLVQYFDREHAFADTGLAQRPGSPPSGEENVATVRALFDELARREDELTFRVLDEEITWDARGFPASDFCGIFHGHDGVRAFWRAWFDAFGRIEYVEGPHHRPHGNQVVSWFRFRTAGKASGAALEQDAGFVGTFQNGRIVRAAVFWSRDDAFRAAGLEPSP